VGTFVDSRLPRRTGPVYFDWHLFGYRNPEILQGILKRMYKMLYIRMEIAPDKYIGLAAGTPLCGEDFCDECGDCLQCYGDDPCFGGVHSWIIADFYLWPQKEQWEYVCSRNLKPQEVP